jgi:hypothetical protein
MLIQGIKRHEDVREDRGVVAEVDRIRPQRRGLERWSPVQQIPHEVFFQGQVETEGSDVVVVLDRAKRKKSRVTERRQPDQQRGQPERQALAGARIGERRHALQRGRHPF